MGTGLALSSAKVQGYAISQDALAQIRPGQSQELVVVVLGSPQTVNAFDEGTAWYYVETKVDQTAFGLTTVRERTVLAIYFDKNKKVADKAALQPPRTARCSPSKAARRRRMVRTRASSTR